MMIPLAEVSRAARPPAQRPLPSGTPTGRMPIANKRNWQPFYFTGLERISKQQIQLLRRLEWLIPGARNGSEAVETVVTRLKDMLEEQVSIRYVSTELVVAAKLHRHIADPTFLAILAPLPNKTRGLIEVELGLSHQLIDSLLGGTGEALEIRPLSEIEEGVMTYVAIESLKALSPALDNGMPKLRLEGLASSFAEVTAMIPEDDVLAVIAFRMRFGPHEGALRLFIPEGVLEQASPPESAEIRSARLALDLQSFGRRLSHVKTTLRAEIGAVEILAADLDGLNAGDVVLVDGLSARPDQGVGGTARLRVGMGRHGSLTADVSVKNGKYYAKVAAMDGAPPPQPGALAAADEAEAQLAEASESEEGEASEEGESSNEAEEQFQGSESMADSESKSLVNDIPLQMTVELGRVTMTGEEVVGIRVGHVFDLSKLSGEPLDLSVNGRVIARGEVVEVDGNLGIRILDLL